METGSPDMMMTTAEDRGGSPGRRRAGISARISILAVALAVLPISLPADERPSSSAADRLGGAFVIQAGRDLKDIAISPAEWKGRGWLNFSLVLGTGLALGVLDEDIRSWTLRNATPESRDVFRGLEVFGNGLFLAALTAGIYGSGEILGDAGLRRTGLLGLESFLTAAALTAGLKFALGRARPYTEEGSGSFHPFSGRSSYYSMPSGHSAGAWAVAAVIAEKTDSGLLDAACYGLAALAALARVHEDKHWSSDIFIGSALGYFVGKKVCALNREGREARLRVSLGGAGGGPAVTVWLAF